MYRPVQRREATEGADEEQPFQQSPCDKIRILLSSDSNSRLPLERIEDRTARILNPDHQLGKTHWSNTCKAGQQMGVQIRLLSAACLSPDESPDNAVEAEVDDKAGVWEAKQRGLPVMNSGWLLVNLMMFSSLVLRQVSMDTFSSEPPWYVVPDSFSLSRNVPKILSYGVPLSP